jgi:hypothetical protein
VGKAEDGKSPKSTALKGLAIKLGQEGQAAICYDLDLCRVAGAWTGGKFVTPMNLMSRGEYPTAMGEVLFTSGQSAGWQVVHQDATAVSWDDPRQEPFGPLPNVRYRGLYVSGEQRVLKWEVGGVEVLELPRFQTVGNLQVFTRTLRIGPSENKLRLMLDSVHPVPPFGQYVTSLAGDSGYELKSDPNHRDRDYVEFPASPETRQFTLVLAFNPKTDSSAEEAASFRAMVEASNEIDFDALTKGGPAHWPEAVDTKGEVSTSKEAYVVDTIALPEKNPWNAPLFLGGFDFFPDGRAAVCTFHGDVFIVSGIDEKLEHVTWKRFATGLYHALGLKVVNGEVYVTGRDGITRLRDLNGDGEADFYEAFNFDVKATKNFHEFVFDLQTDERGNFFFAKAGPVKNGGRGFDEIMEHHGTLLRVTPDGKTLDVYATGFRAPNGIGVGPEGQITSGDNEGTWTPACRLNWIRQSGFYGCVDTAHWAQPPKDYMKPICWLPKRIDNSSGSQVWVTSDKWGPWKDQMLHLSYGTSTLYGVMMEQVHIPGEKDCCAYVMQGGVTAFSLKFQSGIMRARFHPTDGQLYVAGLRGWQTTGIKNGALQRVRYTGEPVRMPLALAARKGGVEMKFASSLDTQAACDPENWSVEAWNYIWSAAYGSPEISTEAPPETAGDKGKEGDPQFSTNQMSKAQHDTLAVKSVAMGTDDRTVFLEIPDLKPVMQMSIKFGIKSADGKELKGEVVNTIHGLEE